jgi:hypothetical protein
MKNIHVLPTDRPSRLYKNDDVVGLHPFPTTLFPTIKICITSDEEIKEGDWFIHSSHKITTLLKAIDVRGRILDNQGTSCNIDYCKKIILTTDQDLIKDGVQAIDDEFLEWFVKHPSCEEVEVNKEEDELVSPKNPKIRFNALEDPPSFISAESLNNMILTYKYKIIIPKEEPKGFIPDGNWNDEEEVQVSDYDKQETLEEVAELESVENKCVAGCKHFYGKEVKHHKDCFYYPESFSKMYDDLEWQQKQDKNKYSEEDMVKFVSFVGKNYIKAKGFYYMKGDFEKKHKVSIHQILEQFKNK